MRRAAVLLRVLLAFLLVFCLIAYLAGSLAAIAIDPDRMLQKMNRFSDTSLSGVQPQEYPALSSSLTEYLKGKADTPQVQVIKHGESAPAFSQKEIQHLEDIKDLIALANSLRYTALGLAAMAIIAFFVIRKTASPELIGLIKPQKALSLSLFLFFGAALVLAVWGLIDFNSLFYAFHRVLFRNDLWLLDARQDLLLQLMPEDFFVSYALDLIKNSALILLSLPLAAYAFHKAGKENA